MCQNRCDFIQITSKDRIILGYFVRLFFSEGIKVDVNYCCSVRFAIWEQRCVSNVLSYDCLARIYPKLWTNVRFENEN